MRLCSADNLRAFALSRLPELAAVVPVVPFIALNYVFERLGWDTVSSVYVQAIFFVKFIAYLGPRLHDAEPFLPHEPAALRGRRHDNRHRHGGDVLRQL